MQVIIFDDSDPSFLQTSELDHELKIKCKLPSQVSSFVIQTEL